MANIKRPVSDNLYHVLLTTSHIAKDPYNVVEKVRIPGTYTSLGAAKAAAHSCLFDAGYERGFFNEYETSPEMFEENLAEHLGLAVYAVAPDETTFRVRIDTTPNNLRLTTDLDDWRVSIPLYYVIETIVVYNGDEDTTMVRDMSVEAVFTTYMEARAYAKTALLSKENKITRESFEDYHQAGPDETDCGYGENVIVHATGDYGENYMISIIQTQALKNVTLAEAAMKIR
ncbi:hypothetical protein EYZ11_005557 [Aspergillus tanneri]|uniref:Uncharacterized protein n=1 Tax=Aspergillus tanneri TaxID=1220188 RepID=A0A4S3JHV5_9EURO|nr:uncharacterized protein ATNIH1004_000978 [Aspergillus tanneri]KAA8652074.1 hypothetical protein ATNIH1004_000978 [Aspergillus tanneri]THC94963.1 hypothetical protein EYZ11_005557 [Aspergillus tanneri]